MKTIDELSIEIQQLKNAMRNHTDYCKGEIRKREREIETQLETEQRQRAAQNTEGILGASEVAS